MVLHENCRVDFIHVQCCQLTRRNSIQNAKLHVAEREKSALKHHELKTFPKSFFPQLSNSTERRRKPICSEFPSLSLSRYGFFLFPLLPTMKQLGLCSCHPQFFSFFSRTEKGLKKHERMEISYFPTIVLFRAMSGAVSKTSISKYHGKTTRHISRNATCFSKRNDNGYYYLPDRMLACIISYSNIADTLHLYFYIWVKLSWVFHFVYCLCSWAYCSSSSMRNVSCCIDFYIVVIIDIRL